MGLPPKNFVDPDDAEANDPKGKGAPEEVEVDEELEKDFHDTLYLKVRVRVQARVRLCAAENWLMWC